MKKIFILIFMLLFAVSLMACNKEKTKEESKEDTKKELVPVESIILKDALGNDVTVTDETPFYDVLTLLNIRKNDKSYLCGKEISFNVEISNESVGKLKFTGDCYMKDVTQFFYDFLILENETQEFFCFQQYFSRIEDLNSGESVSNFTKFQLADELALCGSESTVVDGEESYVTYITDYPTYLDKTSKMSEPYSMFKTFLLEFYDFKYFPQYPDISIQGYYFEYDQYAQRSFKLYEDCIIFEQIDPFGTICNDILEWKFSYYESCKSNEEHKVVQTIKYNLETNSIEEFTMKGRTVSSVFFPHRMLDVDITITISKLNDTKFKMKSNDLIDYIKKQC